MKIVSKELFPAKFLTLVIHIGMVLVIFFVTEDNIYAGISYSAAKSDSEYNKAGNSLLAALSLSLIFMMFELSVLLIGVTLQYPVVSILSISLHTLGIIFLVWYFLLSWRYDVMWSISVLTSFTPFCIELSTLILFKCLFLQGSS